MWRRDDLVFVESAHGLQCRQWISVSSAFKLACRRAYAHYALKALLLHAKLSRVTHITTFVSSTNNFSLMPITSLPYYHTSFRSQLKTHFFSHWNSFSSQIDYTDVWTCIVVDLLLLLKPLIFLDWWTRLAQLFPLEGLLHMSTDITWKRNLIWFCN